MLFQTNQQKNFTGYLFGYEHLKGEQAHFPRGSPGGKSGETRHRFPGTVPGAAPCREEPRGRAPPAPPRAGLASPAPAPAQQPRAGPQGPPRDAPPPLLLGVAAEEPEGRGNRRGRGGRRLLHQLGRRLSPLLAVAEPVAEHVAAAAPRPLRQTYPHGTARTGPRKRRARASAAGRGGAGHVAGWGSQPAGAELARAACRAPGVPRRGGGHGRAALGAAARNTKWGTQRRCACCFV